MSNPEKAIWHYPLTGGVHVPTSVRLPAGAWFVHFGVRGNYFTIWCEVVMYENCNEVVTYRVVPTGGRYSPREWEYVATYADEGTQEFWHLLRGVKG